MFFLTAFDTSWRITPQMLLKIIFKCFIPRSSHMWNLLCTMRWNHYFPLSPCAQSASSAYQSSIFKHFCFSIAQLSCLHYAHAIFIGLMQTLESHALSLLLVSIFPSFFWISIAVLHYASTTLNSWNPDLKSSLSIIYHLSRFSLYYLPTSAYTNF